MARTPNAKYAKETDQYDLFDALQFQIKKRITFESATEVLGEIPANSILGTIVIARKTAWDAITAAELGDGSDTDAYAVTGDMNLTGAIPGGEDGAVEVVVLNKFIGSDTNLTLTLDQGAASEGEAFIAASVLELNP